MGDLNVVAFSLLANPCHVLVDVARIDDQEILLLAAAVNQQVVDRAAVLVEHHAVEDGAVGEGADIVGEDMVHKLLSLRAGDEHLAHVAHVEDAGPVAHRVVLLDDSGILDGHVKTGKRAHLGALCHVVAVQACCLVIHCVSFISYW